MNERELVLAAERAGLFATLASDGGVNIWRRGTGPGTHTTTDTLYVIDDVVVWGPNKEWSATAPEDPDLLIRVVEASFRDV